MKFGMNMQSGETSEGERIRELLGSAGKRVEIIAPFIKVSALEFLLEAIPPDAHIRCVTRWLPREVAAGVSDPEIIDVLSERGYFSLTLVNNLHAKIYIADEKCLVGSANVTLPGLGEAREDNIEVLVESTINDPNVVRALKEIAQSEKPATQEFAHEVRTLANTLEVTQPVAESKPQWFPHSRKPNLAYEFYRHPPPKSHFLTASEQMLVSDLLRADLPPNLEKYDFQHQICQLLETIPIAAELLQATDDRKLTHADAHNYLQQMETAELSTRDLWKAFVKWMTHFFPTLLMEQEISEVALRRAQVLVSANL